VERDTDQSARSRLLRRKRSDGNRRGTSTAPSALSAAARPFIVVALRVTSSPCVQVASQRRDGHFSVLWINNELEAAHMTAVRHTRARGALGVRVLNGETTRWTCPRHRFVTLIPSSRIRSAKPPRLSPHRERGTSLARTDRSFIKGRLVPRVLIDGDSPRNVARSSASSERCAASMTCRRIRGGECRIQAPPKMLLPRC